MKQKDHALHTDVHWGTDADAPCVVYEKRPLTDPKGNVHGRACMCPGFA